MFIKEANIFSFLKTVNVNLHIVKCIEVMYNFEEFG